jgi:hypothetical protein
MARGINASKAATEFSNTRPTSEDTPIASRRASCTCRLAVAERIAVAPCNEIIQWQGEGPRGDCLRTSWPSKKTTPTTS